MSKSEKQEAGQETKNVVDERDGEEKTRRLKPRARRHRSYAAALCTSHAEPSFVD